MNPLPVAIHGIVCMILAEEVDSKVTAKKTLGV
jgi:hypothetical protein